MDRDTIEIILKRALDNKEIMAIHKIIKKPLSEVKEANKNNSPMLSIKGSLKVKDWIIPDTRDTEYYALIEYLVTNSIEFVYRNNNEILTFDEYNKREKIFEQNRQNENELYEKTKSYIDTGFEYMKEENKSSYRKAIKEFTKVLNINNDSFVRYYRALSYYYIGNVQNAKQDLSVLVYNSPNDPEVHYLLGQVYLDDNMFDAAEKEFTFALQYFKPKNKYQINDCIEYLQIIKEIRDNKYEYNDDISEDEVNEEIVKYSDDIDNETSFIEKKQYVASSLPTMNRGPISEIWNKVQGLWNYISSENVPWYQKIAPLAALVYLVSPIDLIPDFIPVAGLLDDVGVITAAVASIGDIINKYTKNE